MQVCGVGFHTRGSLGFLIVADAEVWRASIPIRDTQKLEKISPVRGARIGIQEHG
jgi:hypothetical protein